MGFSLGLERAGMNTVAFCEIDPFCQKVLKKHWPDIPIHDDITKLDGKQYAGTVDLICGGFPCQPFSVAGRKAGTQDNRDLWPEMFRIIKESRPRWVIGENVANFVNMAFTRTAVDLESAGYEVWPVVIPACAIGAPHRRDRVWIIAYANGLRCDAGSDYRQKRPVLYHPNGYAEENQRAGNIGQHGIGTAGEIAADDWRERVQGSNTQSLYRQQAFSWCKDVRRTADYFNRPDIPKPLICRDSDGFSKTLDIDRLINYITKNKNIGVNTNGQENQRNVEEEASKSSTSHKLRVLRKYIESAKASRRLEKTRMGASSMSEMPCECGLYAGQMGKGEEETPRVCYMQGGVSTKRQSQTQNVQCHLPICIREAERYVEMGQRKDRIRGLGNAVVPQIPEIIGRMILEVEGRMFN